MSLFDILACPTCKVPVERHEDYLQCTQCDTRFPIVNGVPVMFPDGSVPEFEHEGFLQTPSNYNPWVHRVILEALLDDQIVLDLGAGNMALDDPCIIRMDVKLSPHVDIVGDAHALPFLPESIDYILSLAVFEHLRNPFLAAQEIYATLKDGGYIYHECNFVFAYHGYPHHYFNASMQGMEQVFAQFLSLRQGVATYQMPSFALDMVIRTYLNASRAEEFAHGRRLTSLLRRVLEQDLIAHDIYFDEAGALQVAAGTYFSGMKQESAESSLIPDVIKEIWRKDKTLQVRFPNINKLTSVDNIITWARQEGRQTYPEIGAYLDSVIPFNKHGADAPWSRKGLGPRMQADPLFGAVGFDPNAPLATNVERAEQQEKEKSNWRRSGPIPRHLWHKYRQQGIRAAAQAWFVYLSEWVAE